LDVHSPRSNKRWFFLAVATLAQVSVAIIHLGIPTLFPFIQSEFRLTRTEVGFLTSLLNGGVVVAALAAGKAADRWGERLVMAYGSMAGGFIALGMNWVTGFGGLLSVLVLLGLATATGTPAGSKAVAGWFPASERGTAMSVRQMSIPLGGAIAAMTLPSLALSHGWRLAVATAGVLTIAAGFAALRLYREPSEPMARSAHEKDAGLKDLLSRRDVWAALVCVFFLAGGQWCYLSYMELYLTEVLSYPITLAASLLALGQFCGTGARIMWGVVSDRLFQSRRKPVIALVAFLAILMTVATSLFSPQTPAWIVASVVALLGVTLMGWNGVYLAMIAETAGSRVAGQAIGLSNTGAFLGIVAIPPVFGFIVDQSGSYRLAWLVYSAAILAALILLRWVNEKQ
jgi:sugar phosphate permease